MIQTQDRGTEAWWTETGADEWADAIVAAMKLGGVEHLFFVSGSELTFYQEAIAKAHAKGWPAPRLVTMTHEHVALNAALGDAMVRNQPAATAVHVDVGTLHYGAAIHTAWRGGYPVLMTAGTGPRAFPGSMRGARGSSVQWVQEPRDQGEIVRQYTKLVDINFYLFTSFRKQWCSPCRNVAGYLPQIGANIAKTYKQKMVSSSTS
jgi:acetolactate synthase-1/2/3 large subunit